ncbi:sensor N-terminal transmembrane domain-containing protein [Anianabacter salinae]|uniref:sensor N-terminal transmembrane domain-containing protein n=1 Tax=Anianabacter salinae TaxID=2851023 RepID=UPI0038994969
MPEDHSRRERDADLVLGEDWVTLPGQADAAMRSKRERKVLNVNRSPLARKIITFNLLAMIVLVAGVLYLSPARQSLVAQSERSLVIDAQLMADIVEARLAGGGSAALDAATAEDAIAAMTLPPGVGIRIFGPEGEMIADSSAVARQPVAGLEGIGEEPRSTLITDFLTGMWKSLYGLIVPQDDRAVPVAPDLLSPLVAASLEGQTRSVSGQDERSDTIFAVATPILSGGVPVAVLGLNTEAGEIDALVRAEREQVLQMFVIAILVSIGLSLVLASTIANPLADLAAAAEMGRDRNSGRKSTGRIRIPDLSGRPDEIGRLSGALRGMVAALYDRIDANEQFAADVAHEIKNPLASLRSAIGTLRMTKRDDHRERLLEVIEHDIQRLDRLVSDISNASRLDSELVKEDEEAFDLLKMLRNLTDYLGNEARGKGVDFITDMPGDPIVIQGLEARLAQVFVNLISNAISFCEDGDAIRVWARWRENRVLIVVEDTGPGIPEQALTKIFNRFYSERPEGQFGNNSGLGLAISKQIVEAHGGVIWAENIRPTDADVTSQPLGARFVVGLPV